ncbi:EAL and HDOD domain-containing protein [Metabacillus fastidiosus]|uniref:EAL and HDOD domain-containing protein n=1 Tax=Metabacillus fastidiosus TaxID=1458 RepID=UPI003D2E41A7
MEVFVARQPIFTKEKGIFAYELLYRNGRENQFPPINGDEATASVIINGFLNIGIDELSNGKPCFINFTENLLHLRLPAYFQQNKIIIEILESIELNKEMLDICKELKHMGYQIALDDFLLNEENPYSYLFMEQADIIKVDFRETTEESRCITEKAAIELNIKLLAEKIETKEEFELAVKNGYTYFQGYFFSKPDILSTYDVPKYFHNYYEIIKHLSNIEPDVDYITKLIEQDLSLSYKLLKLINSPAFRPENKINSIRHAVVLLGFTEIKKWIYILLVRGMPGAKNEWYEEIMNISLIRAKMCEYIAIHKNQQNKASSYFMTGMFSLMDTLLGATMEEILSSLPLQEDICDALKGRSNIMRDILDLTISIEQGEWERMIFYSEKLDIKDEVILELYNKSINWSSDLTKV